MAFSAFISTIKPKNIKKAVKVSKWVNTMQEKLYQLERSKVWHLVLRPANMSIIGSKKVSKNKHDKHGTIISNKARLRVQGYNQEKKIDYDETFNIRLEAIRILIDFTAFMIQIDVKSAFLNGCLKE